MPQGQVPADRIDELADLDPLHPDRLALARVLELAYQRGLEIRKARAASSKQNRNKAETRTAPKTRRETSTPAD